MTSCKDALNFIVDHHAKGLPLDAISEVLDRLVWIFADNGAEIATLREEWLDGDDVIRLEIALRMQDLFPYNDRPTMILKFDRIKRRWPELQRLCQGIVERWDEQFK